MNYTTTTKLKRSFGDKAELILEDVKDAHLSEIIKNTSLIIDGYIGIVYSDVKPNAILDQCCINIAKAEIYRRFASNDIPRAVADAERAAYETLEKVQQKKIVLQAAGVRGQEAVDADARMTSAPRVFKN